MEGSYIQELHMEGLTLYRLLVKNYQFYQWDTVSEGQVAYNEE